MNESFFQSQEFKRASSNAADTGVKFIFKWIGIGIGAAANAVKAMIMSIIGK
ncbi:MAG: hypothetical protein BroJett025_02840 [Patescibacteria group bacterium]|nr:MAG: hypothetical protein BroJett025_02840 [Patescibacteria group bacterium]